MSVTIDAIEVRHYRLPLEPPFCPGWDSRPRTAHTVSVVRICAGDLEGVGSGGALLGLAGNESLFLDHDPTDLERHAAILDNLQFHYGRVWPLEVALWDLTGKIRGQPLWRLLGGTTPRVPLYASTGSRLPPDERVASALAAKRAGFKAIKLRFGGRLDDDLALVRAVRGAIGQDLEILVDANQGWRMPWDDAAPWDLDRALRVAAALAELDVYWIEEPLHRHAFEELAELRRRSAVRIAGGEGNREWAEHLSYLKHGCLDVYQFDAAWSTGIHRARELAALVSGANALFTPHTWGDGLVLLANLHVAAACANAPFVEYPYDPPEWTPERRDFLLERPLAAEADGTLELSEKPGLGVELDWAALDRWRIDAR